VEEMNYKTQGKIAYTIWLIFVFCVIFGFAFFMITDSQAIHAATEKQSEQVKYCKENPCICRCEYAGNGGLEECTYLCRGGY
jgi:hypothetical protein